MIAWNSHQISGTWWDVLPSHLSHYVSIQKGPFRELAQLACNDLAVSDATDQPQKTSTAAEIYKKSTIKSRTGYCLFSVLPCSYLLCCYKQFHQQLILQSRLFGDICLCKFPQSYNQSAWVNQKSRTVTLLGNFQVPRGKHCRPNLRPIWKWQIAVPSSFAKG